ncbi:MAG TPA: hypothetical protein PKM55_16980, partial [Acidobacteriota bacterium]|nr:hypothetical protein [Acidobacteriota bacterium]
MVRTIRYLVIGCWLVGLWTGTMIAQDSQYEFGVVPFFKNYPEFKRGFDPYADLSGTVQENVDRYSGKLSLTFQLPGIPWSETTAFAPVLHYTSNVWSYRQSYGDKFLVGGLNKMGEPPPQEPPFDYERPQVKFPDYWGNDAWVRFSPIGRPHAMPGWTLAVGGVYTEFVKSAEEIGSTGETNHYKTWVEKKIFVSPDGTPHVMLDVETRGRPFMTGAFFTTPPDDPNYCNPEYDPLSHARECLPRSRWNDPTLVTGVWQAIDGSHYYYLEDQHKVYAADGTCYELVSDPNDRFYGMISRIIDPRGNAITVTVQDPGEHVTGVRTYRYASNTGAWLELRFDQVVENHFAPFDPFDPHIDYQLDILLLKQIIWSGVDGNPLTYTFTRSELIDHLRLDDPSIPATMTFADVLATPDGDGIISCYGSFLDLDISNWVFCSRDQPANGSEVTNKRIHVLTGIILPDGRRYQFQYNRAGKLSHVLYPDGGYRHYLYGNTREPSTPVEVNCPPMGWHGREAGSSPFGGVSLVYQSEAVGATEQLERAYAYCGYWTDNGVPQPGETITWYADGSAQLHRFAAPEIWEDRRKLLQFGYSAWTTGKLERVQYYTQGPTALDDPTLRRFLWISQEGDPHPMATSEYMQLKTDLNIGGGTAPRALLREEESYWTNYSAGWEWSPPEGYCPNCLPGDRQIALSVYFQDLIPGPGQSWAGSPFVNYYRPEWNTVLARKVEKTYEGGGAPVVHRTDYEYGDAIAWGWTAVHAVQTGQKEFDTVGGTTPYRRSATEYQHFWPHPDSIPTGMPARVLGLATRSQVYDASEQVISESFTNYVEDPVATANTLMGLQPRRTLSLIQSSPERWSETEMEYEMRTVGSSSAVRLVTVKPKDSGAVRNTVRFDYDPASGLLRNLRAYTGDESVLKLYMCLDHDPFTGLLRRRMDRNGDRDGDCQFDAGDDYIEFSYDAFNRLSGVARWHGGKAEVLSAYLYPDTTPFVVQRCDYLDEQTRRWTRVRNDALGRAAETWTTLTGDQAAYSVKTFDVLGRVVTESNPVAVTVNPVTGTWNTDGSAYVTTSAYDALGRVVARTAPGGFTVSTAFGLGTARDIVTGAATIPATTERVTEQVGDEARWRQLYRDAFGRIVQVDECLPDGGAGEWRTLYGYDAADRLRQVDKRAADGASGQRRVFDYNAAGWLTAVQLPEYADQKMRYAYDDLGNVTAKELVSAMYGSSLGYAETLAYDALSRLTARTVTFSDRLVHHTFTYDGGAVAAPPA